MVGHLWGIYPRVVQLNLLLVLFPIFWESSRLISWVVVPFSNPSSNRGVFLFLHLLPNMCSHLSFWSGPFRLVYGGISGSLWFTFPWSLRILNISSSASQLFEISLLWDLCLVLYPVFDWVEWEISFLSSYLFWIVELVKIFFPICWLLVCLLTMSFAFQKLFSFMRSHLSILDLRSSATGVLFRKFYHMPMSLMFFPTFSSIIFSVLGFMLRSLIHLGLSFLQGHKVLLSL